MGLIYQKKSTYAYLGLCHSLLIKDLWVLRLDSLEETTDVYNRQLVLSKNMDEFASRKEWKGYISTSIAKVNWGFKKKHDFKCLWLQRCYIAL